MRLILLLMLTLPVTACVTATDGAAICDGTEASRDTLAAALLEDGGDSSVVAGQALIAQLDAACR